MNTFARYASLAAALSALLITSGCFTTESAGTVPARVDYQITVVDNSKGLQLTKEQAAEIRASAVNYLKENGLTQGGEYLVRVSLTPDRPEETEQWVVLRISNVPARTYTLLGAYPASDDLYPYDFYGFYNYGFPSFARYGYYDPMGYGYGYGGSYFPPGNWPDWNHKPRDYPKHPPGTHTRWDGNRPNPDQPPGPDCQPDPNKPKKRDRTDYDRPRAGDNQPHRPYPAGEPRQRPRNRDDDSSWSGRNHNSGQGDPRPSTAGSAPAYNPPPAPVQSAPSNNPPPARAEPAPRDRDDRSLSQNER